MNDNSIRCQASVDVIVPPPAIGEGLGCFRVFVTGVKPHDYARIYEIVAPDDNIAARRGLDRFIDEISKLLSRSSVTAKDDDEWISQPPSTGSNGVSR
jgi:hypothetical protein